MLAQWLVKKTANDSVKNKRQKIGYLGGIVGAVINLALFASKFAIGIFLNSVSILADAFNNL